MDGPKVHVGGLADEWLAARGLHSRDVIWVQVPVGLVEGLVARREGPAGPQPRPRVAHDLKCDPEPFEALIRGKKTFEYRKNDRDFRAGDVLVLREWFVSTGTYSGRAVYATVSYVAQGGRFGIPGGYCVMALAARAQTKEEEEACPST